MHTEAGTTNGALRGPKRIVTIDNQRPPVVEESVTRLMGDLDASSLTVPDEGQRNTWKRVLGKLAFGFLTLAVLVGGWWAIAVLGNYPQYILPTPPVVAERAWTMVLSGSLFMHFWTTFLEAGLGFLLALFVGSTLGYLIARSPLLEKLVSPYIGVSQGLPVVALAPLLVIWFKEDLVRNAVVVALIVFFPILVNTIVGLRNIDRSMLEMARISGANFGQTIRYVEIPLGMRGLLAGVKLGLTLSITGAVIGELISANSGLGFLLSLGRSNFDTPLMFVGLVSLATLTMSLYAFVTILEKLLIDSD